MGEATKDQYVPDQKERNFAKIVYWWTILPGDLAVGVYGVFGYMQGSKVLPKFVEFHLNQAKKLLIWTWPILALILVPVGIMMLVPSLNNTLLYAGIALATVWLLILISITLKCTVEAGAGRWTKIWPNK